jgi:hypothetical protein
MTCCSRCVVSVDVLSKGSRARERWDAHPSFPWQGAVSSLALGWMAFQGSLHIATTYLIQALLGLAQLRVSCTKPIALLASS